MEPLRRFVSIVFLVTCFGIVLCNEDNCGHVYWHSLTMPADVFKTGNDCVEMGATGREHELLRDAKTDEDYRRFFRGFCQRQSIIRECLANSTKRYEICQGETYLQTYNIYRGLLETLLDTECTGESQRLALFWRGFHTLINNQTEVMKILPCVMRSATMAQYMQESSFAIASKVFIMYNEMHWFKGCVHQAELDPEFKEVVDLYLSEIIKRMKCINPRDDTFETCGTIDTSLIREKSICSNDALSSMYDSLEDLTARCFEFLLEFDVPPFQGDFNNSTVDKMAVCYYKNIPDCLAHLIPYSQICLNGTQQQDYRILIDFLNSFLKNQCSGDEYPQRIIDVLSEFYRLKRTGQGHAVWVCLDVAKATRNVKDTQHGSGSKNMRFYHELESFKTCLVEKLRGDRISVDATTSLIDEMRRTVTCLHPQDGTMVLCETIVDTPQ